jgi:hypothetical protein
MRADILRDWRQAWKSALEDSTTRRAPAEDRLAGRRFAIIAWTGDTMTLRDERGQVETVTLGYGARQTIAEAVAERRAMTPVGLLVLREPFEVEDLTFWRWRVVG